MKYSFNTLPRQFSIVSLQKCVSDFTADQKQPSRGVLRKRYSENMQHISKRTPMPKRNFKKVAQQGKYQSNTCGRCSTLQTHHAYPTLKRRGNSLFGVVSKWNTPWCVCWVVSLWHGMHSSPFLHESMKKGILKYFQIEKQ